MREFLSRALEWAPAAPLLGLLPLPRFLDRGWRSAVALVLLLGTVALAAAAVTSVRGADAGPLSWSPISDAERRLPAAPRFAVEMAVLAFAAALAATVRGALAPTVWPALSGFLWLGLGTEKPEAGLAVAALAAAATPPRAGRAWTTAWLFALAIGAAAGA
ncbi:MAG TPA: hypothetical protein VNC50_00295, partial [Planctomycetia bacterium]|nr:hypothetical protein [Planctomycetia bacterium]